MAAIPGQKNGIPRDADAGDQIVGHCQTATLRFKNSPNLRRPMGRVAAERKDDERNQELPDFFIL